MVFSDDPTEPKVFVQLLGGVAAPQLTVDPSSIDFGEIQAQASSCSPPVTVSQSWFVAPTRT